MAEGLQSSVIRTYKVKLYPTAVEEAALFRLWGAAKLTYNLFLEQRMRAEREGIIYPITVLADRFLGRVEARKTETDWLDPLPPIPFMPPRNEDGKVKPLAKLTAYDQMKFVKQLRPHMGWMHLPSVVFYQQPKNVDAGFKSFYALIRNSKNGAGNKDARPPKFKNRSSSISIGFMNGSERVVLSARYIRIMGVGVVKTRMTPTLPDWALAAALARGVNGEIEQASYYEITRDTAGTWWLHFIFKNVPIWSESSEKSIGVDLGITHLAAWHDSEGQRGLIANLKPYKEALGQLRELNQGLDRIRRTYFRLNQLEDTPDNRKMHSRTAWGSGRAKALQEKKNRLLRHTVRVRRHAISTAVKFLSEYDTVVIEALNVKGMGQGKLARDIHDAAWGHLHRELERKAAEAGRTVLRVNPAYTSQTCAGCGHVEKDNRKGEAFLCLSCGHQDHADLNAARNILMLGLHEPVATRKPRPVRAT